MHAILYYDNYVKSYHKATAYKVIVSSLVYEKGFVGITHTESPNISLKFSTNEPWFQGFYVNKPIYMLLNSLCEILQSCDVLTCCNHLCDKQKAYCQGQHV